MCAHRTMAHKTNQSNKEEERMKKDSKQSTEGNTTKNPNEQEPTLGVMMCGGVSSLRLELS